MQKNNPILIHVPHSATYIPPEELRYFVKKRIRHELAVMTDHYCDDLYRTGNAMLRFPISRLVCDPERFRNDADEIMSAVGMGAIYLACSDGTELKTVSEKHKEELLLRYYDRHHSRFEDAVSKNLQRYGKCLIVDGHSFYDEPLPYEHDQDPDRPEICIGTDNFHTPAEVEEMLRGYFEKKGYDVGINRPFAGCIVPTRFYQKDARVMSVMIEINRGIYMDHGLKKTQGYERVKKDIATAIELLEDYIMNDTDG